MTVTVAHPTSFAFQNKSLLVLRKHFKYTRITPVALAFPSDTNIKGAGALWALNL
jgi:hypothetical protein